MVSLFKDGSVLPFNGTVIQLNRSPRFRFFDVAGWWKLFRIIQRHDIELVQANAGDTLKFSVLSRLLFRWSAKLIFRNANKMSDFVDTRFKFYFNRFLLRQSDHIISVSDYSRQDLISVFGVPDKKITTVEIGIDQRSIGDYPRDIMGISSGKTVLLNVASLVPEKNHAGLLRIFAAIRKQHPGVILLLVGSGQGEQALKKLISESDLHECVFLLGNRKDVLEIMKGTNVFLLPSLIEGLPGVILESMYCRCPVVAYEVGGISEVIKQNRTGKLVMKNDETGFAGAVLEVLNSDTDRFEITENAFGLVVKKYDNRGIAKRFEQVYQMVLAQEKATARAII